MSVSEIVCLYSEIQPLQQYNNQKYNNQNSTTTTFNDWKVVSGLVLQYHFATELEGYGQL